MSGAVLTDRALNRALLARQHLLEPTAEPVSEVIEHLVGLQAQAPLAPYVGLWSRMERFAPDDLGRLLIERHVVRLVVMRGTIHLVTADDALPLRALTQPILDGALRARNANTTGLDGVDLGEVAAASREVLADEPLTARELGEALGPSFPDIEPLVLAFAARALLPLVQVPPRGVWGQSGPPRLVPAEQWLGRRVEPVQETEWLAERYLAAFGPASVADLQTWCGLRGMAEVINRLRPRLETFVAEDGRELFDIPTAPRPPADTPAPVRMVAEFDNLLLSHADRTRVMSDVDRSRVFANRNGVIPGTVLVDGFVAGTWRVRRARGGQTTLVVTPHRRLAKRWLGGVEREGRRLLAFVAPDAERAEVEVVAPAP